MIFIWTKFSIQFGTKLLGYYIHLNVEGNEILHRIRKI